MTEGVKEFLNGLGLGAHFDMFVAKGFEKEGDIPYLTGDDLTCMYITDEDDREKILEACKLFRLF